ncbi:MAG: hypothetical protein V2A65_04940 [Candidatus Omnitrophota bacterium]
MTAPKSGSILIIALFALATLTIVAVNLGFGISQKLLFLKKMEVKKNLHLIAEAGIKTASWKIKKDVTPEYDTLNGTWSNNVTDFREQSVGEGRFTVSYDYRSFDTDKNKITQTRYGCEDEERKISINTADQKTLKRLFQIVTDIDEAKAENLSYCIIDWRDENSSYEHPQYGAEDSDYRYSSTPYEAKDGPYEIPEELLLVKGMSREIFEQIREYVTVYTEGKININTAPLEVLRALGLDERLAAKILTFRKGQDGVEGTPDDNVFTSPDVVATLNQFVVLGPDEISQFSNLAGRFTTASNNFMIKSIARLNNRNDSYAIVAVCNRKGQIKYWREE